MSQFFTSRSRLIPLLYQSVFFQGNDVHQDVFICSYCSYVVSNIDVHLTICEKYIYTVEETYELEEGFQIIEQDNREIEGETEESEVEIHEIEETQDTEEETQENKELCMFCGVFFINLNEHLKSGHDVQEDMFGTNGKCKI